MRKIKDVSECIRRCDHPAGKRARRLLEQQLLKGKDALSSTANLAESPSQSKDVFGFPG
ncbi:MAG: hypothetical protein R2861_04695 [Desulfobacterales bacterium]